MAFSKRTLKICREMPSTPEAKRIRGQLAGSVFSIGANYEEADGSHTWKDFANKLIIARKEAKEAKFFFELIHGSYYPSGSLEKEIKELDEIIRILSSMIKNSTRHERNGGF